MNIVQWNSEYSVGIQELDEQHKCIIAYINELYEAMTKKSNRELVVEVIHKLVDYTKIHFAVEETLMRIFNYDEYEEHKVIHDNIVQQVLMYQGKFMAGEDKVGMDLLMFLKGWLFEHISHVDKQYTQAFHAAGVKKSWLKNFW